MRAFMVIGYAHEALGEVLGRWNPNREYFNGRFDRSCVKCPFVDVL